MTNHLRRIRRITPPLVEEVQQNLQDMLDRDAIRLSQSPWCNTVVLVRKKDWSRQFCIDFRQLYSYTKKDPYPLPQMQETMESMVGTQHFSCMDLKSGFWQVKMSEKFWQYTAFTVGSMGVFEFLQMPYGLCNALVMFQWLIQNCLGELNLTYALIYLDNVIVYLHTEDDHLTQLRAILKRFQEHRLKLKPSKCNFFCTEINYLGHKVSVKGLQPGTKEWRGITEIALPMAYTEVRKFVGATRFFHWFMKNYVRIAKPLNDLLQGENSKLKGYPVNLPLKEPLKSWRCSVWQHRCQRSLISKSHSCSKWMHCPLPEERWWQVPSGGTCQLGAEGRWTKVSLFEAQIPCPQVGHYQTV